LALDPSRDGDPACVIKRLPAELRDAADVKTRFRREAHLARRLSHETLVTILAVGDLENEPYLVQEFVEGHDLGTVLERCAAERRRMPVAAAVFMAREIARALDYVHGFEGLKLVHRNVCPARVHLGYEGQTKLLGQDLGRASGTGISERHAWAAPEQAASQTVDGRADLYTLGAVLWEALTGQPYIREAPLGEPPPAEVRPQDAPSAFNGEVPAELDQVVMRMLAHEPDRRWASARDVENALASVQMPRGQESLATLMNRLFDASSERNRRAGLFASARKALPAGATQLVVVNPAAATEERELPPMPRNEPPAMAAPSGSAGVPKQDPVEPRERPATGSVTLQLRPTSPWWRRFLLFFGLALIGAVSFNRYMTARLQAQWSAEGETEKAALAAPQLPPQPSPSPVDPPQAAEPAESAPAPAVVEPAPLPNRPSIVVHAGAAPSPSPDSRPRQTASADPARGAATLERARAAFEHDEFAKAVELGQTALGAGDRRAYAVLGAAYFKLGRYREAERAYNEAARVEPDNTVFRKRAESAHRMAEAHAGAAAE
jgi:serine/threonine protein kinase